MTTSILDDPREGRDAFKGFGLAKYTRSLFGMAVIGGSIGALAGMYTFRHKTQKWYYTITVPVLLI